MENEKIRLQKYISDCGIMSRRSAERQIEAGRVTVNGNIALLGEKVSPGDDVRIDGRRIGREHTGYTYIMLNKPIGYVTTMSDERGRRSVSELVADAGVRVWPVGRLDMESEGLLLLTNDGDLTNRLTHPSHSVPKIYNVRIEGELTREQIKQLGRPIEIDGRLTRPVSSEVVSLKDNCTVLRMTLYEGRNREIRRLCERDGYKVLRLCRVMIGEIALGDLHPGKWRRLTKTQTEYLKRLI